MKRLSFFVTLSAALAIAATLSFAHEGETKHRFKFKVDAGSAPIVIDDLAVGETRQFFTDSGKEVVVTRAEDGIQLTVDGKEIDVAAPHGAHGAVIVGGGDGEHVNVIVKKIDGDGEEGEHVMVWHGDGEHEAHDVMVWTGEEGQAHAWTGEEGHRFAFVGAPDVAGSVLESGVLDDLDPAKREEIVKAIKDASAREVHRVHRKVVVDGEDDRQE